MRPDSSIHWSAYPALLVACAFTLGILVDSVLERGGLGFWVGGGLAGLLLFGAVQWRDQTRIVTLAPLGRIVAVLLVVGCAGGARHAAYREPSPRALSPVAKTSEEATTVRGVVADAPERAEEATRFTLSVDAVLGTEDTSRVDGQARVTFRSPPWSAENVHFPQVYEGDIVRLRGELRPAPGLRNPGGFDYAAYLARRGTCCVMYVGEPEYVAVRGNRRGMLRAAIVTARQYVRRQVTRYVAHAAGRAVLRALLLGDRSRISDAQRDRFSTTGLMHLLAVSGLHVFLVGMVLYTLLRPLLMRFALRWRAVETGRAVFTIVVLGFYMLLTGARPSVVRAVVMASLFIGGIVFQRSAHSLNTLGVAAVVLLAVRPPALFDVGFQLSMAAVAGIVTLNPRFLEMVPERFRRTQVEDWVVSTGTVSAAAILGTAPVLLYHFGWVSVAGLLLNTVGIPCTGLALSAAIAMVVFGGFWTVAGVAFGGAADLCVQALLATSRYGAEWFSWAGIRMETPEPWLIGALVAGLVAIAQWPRPRLRWRGVIVALLLVVVSVWGNAIGQGSAPTLDLVFFDVGHGDAALLATPGGQHVLVDAGPRSPSGGTGEFVVLPYLEQRGIDHLDAVVVTHPDGDHLGGVPAILKGVSVGRVIHSGQATGSDVYAESRRVMEQLGIANRAVQRGDTLAVDAGIRIQVVGPSARPLERGVDGENNRSVVLHVAYGTADFLLTGDVEAAGERDLVRTYGDQLASRVVKIPHHGSSTSSTRPFVRAAVDTSSGTYAVVSVGQDDRYGMPSERVLSRWERSGTRVLSTADRGAVWMRTDGSEVWQVPWK